MTDDARTLSAWEANEAAGTMMAGRVVMCCRMCRWDGDPRRARAQLLLRFEDAVVLIPW